MKEGIFPLLSIPKVQNILQVLHARHPQNQNKSIFFEQL
jgi:hypothetical protein